MVIEQPGSQVVYLAHMFGRIGPNKHGLQTSPVNDTFGCSTDHNHICERVDGMEDRIAPPASEEMKRALTMGARTYLLRVIISLSVLVFSSFVVAIDNCSSYVLFSQVELLKLSSSVQVLRRKNKKLQRDPNYSQ